MIQTIDDLQRLIDNKVSLEDIKQMLNKDIDNTSFNILSLRGRVEKTISRLQEPISGMKYQDSDIIQVIISDLGLFNNSLIELNSAGSIINYYQKNLNGIINVCNGVEEEDNLLNLIRSYGMRSNDENFLLQGTKVNEFITSGYQKLERTILTFLELNYIGIDVNNFKQKIDILAKDIEERYTLSYCQGVLSGVMAVILRLTDKLIGPLDAFKLISMFGEDVLATILAFAKVRRNNNLTSMDENTL